MLNVQRKSEKTLKGDLIAFFNENRFIGYGKVVDILDDILLIDEDAQIKNELNTISNSKGLYNIEID